MYSVDNPFSGADVCPSAGLRCGGYGSAVVVTSSFAMVAVAEVLKTGCAERKEKILMLQHTTSVSFQLHQVTQNMEENRR